MFWKMKPITEYLFKKYYRELCHYAWQYVGDIDVSRDLVQDVFANFHTRTDLLPKDVNEAYYKNYLFVATRNSCNNHYKKLKTINKYWEFNTFNEEDDYQMEIEFIRSEVIGALYDLLLTLPKGCQSVMHKAYVEGLSNIEIAQELNLSINTVKTQKQRGLKVIKEKLHPDLLIWFAIFFFY